MPVRSGLYNPARVYDLLGELLAGLNVFSLLFCLFLNIKVRCLKPSCALISSQRSLRSRRARDEGAAREQEGRGGGDWGMTQ